MQCDSCSVTAPLGSRFCPSCGQRLTAWSATPTSIAPVDATTIATASGDRTDLPEEGTRLPANSGQSGGSDDVSFTVGQMLAGRYRIVRALGKGGMGAVFLAEDVRLGHKVALKFLPSALAWDPRRLAQFQNEVSLSRQITHPNVCRVYDIGDADGLLFLSMEYIEGEDLAHAIARRGRYDMLDGLEIVWQVCAGLSAVHARGVFHRDLKPANVMVDRDGNARLMDFGIAASGVVDLVAEGTPAYMAPEQLLGREVTDKSDIFALGLLMCELFTGRRVNEGKSFRELVDQESLAALQSLDAAGVQPHVKDVIGRCLDRNPAHRPAPLAVASAAHKVLLDRAVVGRRLMHSVLGAGSTLPLVVATQLLLTRAVSGSRIAFAAALVAISIVIAIIMMRSAIGWTVNYKGHELRFRNHPIRGEQLFIDGVKADRGRVAVSVMMRGTIQSGLGTGERITVQSRAALHKFSCQMIAEYFGR